MVFFFLLAFCSLQLVRILGSSPLSGQRHHSSAAALVTCPSRCLRLCPSCWQRLWVALRRMISDSRMPPPLLGDTALQWHIEFGVCTARDSEWADQRQQDAITAARRHRVATAYWIRGLFSQRFRIGRLFPLAPVMVTPNEPFQFPRTRTNSSNHGPAQSDSGKPWSSSARVVSPAYA